MDELYFTFCTVPLPKCRVWTLRPPESVPCKGTGCIVVACSSEIAMNGCLVWHCVLNAPPILSAASVEKFPFERLRSDLVLKAEKNRPETCLPPRLIANCRLYSIKQIEVVTLLSGCSRMCVTNGCHWPLLHVAPWQWRSCSMSMKEREGRNMSLSVKRCHSSGCGDMERKRKGRKRRNIAEWCWFNQWLTATCANLSEKLNLWTVFYLRRWAKEFMNYPQIEQMSLIYTVIIYPHQRHI